MHRINHKFKEMLKIMEMLKTMNNNFSLIFENEESRAIPVANDKEELFFLAAATPSTSYFGTARDHVLFGRERYSVFLAQEETLQRSFRDAGSLVCHPYYPPLSYLT